MRIAILDDEQAFLEAASQRILTLLQQNFPQEASDLSVDLFATAGALLRSAESVVYDLAILDICMDGINGMEAAEQIRARDSEAGILFVTRSEAYLLDGYRVFADGYFLKPLDQQDDAVLIAARASIFKNPVYGHRERTRPHRYEESRDSSRKDKVLSRGCRGAALRCAFFRVLQQNHGQYGLD